MVCFQSFQFFNFANTKISLGIYNYGEEKKGKRDKSGKFLKIKDLSIFLKEISWTCLENNVKFSLISMIVILYEYRHYESNFLSFQRKGLAS